MPAQKPISREYRIYLALWRKAFLTDTELTIKASNLSMAVAMRQGMYRAIRPFRNGQANDNELREAAEKFIIFLVKADEKNDPHFLQIRRRATLSELDAMFDTLGIDEDDLLLSDERKINESLKKIAAEKLPRQVKTPFFTRDE